MPRQWVGEQIFAQVLHFEADDRILKGAKRKETAYAPVFHVNKARLLPVQYAMPLLLLPRCGQPPGGLQPRGDEGTHRPGGHRPGLRARGGWPGGNHLRVPGRGAGGGGARLFPGLHRLCPGETAGRGAGAVRPADQRHPAHRRVGGVSQRARFPGGGIPGWQPGGARFSAAGQGRPGDVRGGHPRNPATRRARRGVQHSGGSDPQMARTPGRFTPP